jgi:hypothetical protein
MTYKHNLVAEVWIGREEADLHHANGEIGYETCGCDFDFNLLLLK